MLEFNTLLSQTKPKMPFQWSGTLRFAGLNPIPHKYRPSRRRGRQRPKVSSSSFSHDSVTSLKTSFNILGTIRMLRRRRWSLLDTQYIVLFGYISFSLFIAPSAPLIKTGAFAGLAILLLMPITQQFFFPSLPIWTYLLYFFCSRYVPNSFPSLSCCVSAHRLWRPPHRSWNTRHI